MPRRICGDSGHGACSFDRVHLRESALDPATRHKSEDSVTGAKSTPSRKVKESLEATWPMESINLREHYRLACLARIVLDAKPSFSILGSRNLRWVGPAKRDWGKDKTKGGGEAAARLPNMPPMLAKSHWRFRFETIREKLCLLNCPHKMDCRRLVAILITFQFIQPSRQIPL